MDIKLFLQSLSKEERAELISYIITNNKKLDITTWVDMQNDMSAHLKRILLNYKYGNKTPFQFVEDITLHKFNRLRGVGPKAKNELFKFLIFRTSNLESGMVYDKKFDCFIRE